MVDGGRLIWVSGRRFVAVADIKLAVGVNSKACVGDGSALSVEVDVAMSGIGVGGIGVDTSAKRWVGVTVGARMASSGAPYIVSRARSRASCEVMRARLTTRCISSGPRASKPCRRSSYPVRAESIISTSATCSALDSVLSSLKSAESGRNCSI